MIFKSLLVRKEDSLWQVIQQNIHFKRETGQGNLLKGIEEELAKQEASTDMKLKNLPKYLKK